jgi:hypothetical protein
MFPNGRGRSRSQEQDVRPCDLSEFSLALLSFLREYESPLNRPCCRSVNFRRTVGVGLGAGVSVGLSEGFADGVAVTVVVGVGVALDAAVIGNTV